MNHQSCTCFIVPPKMLRHLADRTTGAERDALVDSMLLTEHLRGFRAARQMTLLANSAGEKRRTIYNCHHAQSTPPHGKLVRAEGDPPSADATVNEAYDSTGTTYDFYQKVLNRNSVDAKGMRLDSFVHYGRGYNNAFWDGAEMTFGDGDGKLFLGFASALDVVAHELTHGVTQFTVPGGLDYVDQSGALNESISDVFGSVVKQWKLGQSVDQADWLIGPGIMAPAVGQALRSMKDPGNPAITWTHDDQPKTMTAYVQGGDVHTNSGIPNHAFFLAATGIGGNSWDQAAHIWYTALPLLTSNATFADAAKATIQTAGNLYGPASSEQTAVEGAWREVRVI